MNGPDDVHDWDAVDWRAHEDIVARLRRRIFTATARRPLPSSTTALCTCAMEAAATGGPNSTK